MTVTSATTSTSTATSTTNSSTAALSSDYTMFLKLLTTQLQNQDPMNPMDTAQYTQQLVQYSQVEQSIEQNTTLKSILSAMGSSDLSQASSLIGQKVAFDSASTGLGDSPAQWDYTASRSVSSITATITNASGKTVDTRTITPDGLTGSFNWDGTLSTGGTAPAGAYTLTLTGKDSSGSDVDVSVQSVGTVQEVQSSNGTVSLQVNGQSMPLSSVVRVTGKAA